MDRAQRYDELYDLGHDTVVETLLDTEDELEIWKARALRLGAVDDG